jgi:hypothetical protein
MKRTAQHAVVLALVAGIASAITLTAAPAPMTKTEIVKDRETFIPLRKYAPVPGKVIGLLVSDVAPKMSHDGRGGPADAMGFSVDNGSYRWVYVPVAGPDAIIQNLQVPVGEKGGRVQVYPLLNMANPKTVKQWNIQVPYALVEMEVNNEQGSPAGESFVGTKMTRLDGTKDYPLNVAETVADLKKRHAEWKKEQKEKLDEALMGAQKKAIADRKPTGPQETQELMYMTWLPESKRMRVAFRTTITDGEYRYVGGGIGRDPIPLPVPPGKPLPQPQGFAAFPPPPPIFPRVRTGTSFGIEFGVAYEVTASGKIDRIQTLPAEPFVKELPVPPGRGGPRLPVDPLPPKLLPARN